jgi:hypothetical protein
VRGVCDGWKPPILRALNFPFDDPEEAEKLMYENAICTGAFDGKSERAPSWVETQSLVVFGWVICYPDTICQLVLLEY